MIEQNPQRRIARLVAFACYIFAGLVLIAGVFFTLAAATVDMSQLRLEGVTNGRMAVMVGSTFVIAILMIVLFGWRVQSLFGQHRRQEKLVARSAVGCLRLSSLGCGLWSLVSACTVLVTGKLLATGEPAGIKEIFIGSSGFVIAIILMLAVAWFISTHLLPLTPDESKRIYQAYLNGIQTRLLVLADPETRAYLQAQTTETLTKLDATLKSSLLRELGKLGLLTGDTRIALSRADFRGVDLCLVNLPKADLREIDLEEAKLEGATLPGANLYNAKLKKANLSNARLQETNLSRADLTGAVLKEAKLRAADLTETILKDADLSHAGLQGANLQRADLTGALLKQTDLRGADLSGTIVTPEQLRQANL